jgi:transposase InsO family protein
VARCTVERLMRELVICGASPGRKRPPTTLPGDPEDRPSDLLERCFDAAAPNRRWVADITYVTTVAGWVYTAFVMDLFARTILGWQVADHLRSDLALDALEMAIWARRDEDLGGLVHHSDRGVQYTSIRYAERLAGAVQVACCIVPASWLSQLLPRPDVAVAQVSGLWRPLASIHRPILVDRFGSDSCTRSFPR